MREEYKPLARDIALKVRNEMESKQLQAQDLASVIANDIGLKESSALNYVSGVRNNSYNLPSPFSHVGGNNERKKLRLAILLNALEIPADDGIITKLQEVYSGNFEYPPTTTVPEQEERRTDPDNLPLVSLVRRLNPEDHQRVEGIVRRRIKSYN